jgi:hypothetical protein
VADIDDVLPTITDEQMRAMLPGARAYSLVLLRPTEKRAEPGANEIVWEHGRRNFALREHGLLSVVCPVMSGEGLSGVGIFAATPEETAAIMDGDPGVQAGVFTYEVYAVRGFPGSTLPG